MPLTGDFAKLGTLIEEMKQFSRTAYPAATEAAKQAIEEAWYGDMREQTGPDGVPWKPRKDGTAGKILFQSGTLANPAITARSGVVRLTPVRYAWYHQVGANNMHERNLVPYGPSRWDEPISDRVVRAIEEEMPSGD